MHPAVGVDHRGRVAGRTHAARADRVHVVGHGREQPRVDRRRRSSRSSIGVVSASTPSLIARRWGSRTMSTIRRTQSRSRMRSRSSVSMRNSTTGIDARDPPTAIAPRPCEKTRMTAPMSRAAGEPPRARTDAVEPDDLHVVRARVGELRGVAQHRREHRGVGRGRIAPRSAAPPRIRRSPRAPSGSRRPRSPSPTPIPDRSRIAGEWIAPALTITSPASISSPSAVRTPTARGAVEDDAIDEARRRARRGSAGARGLEVGIVRRHSLGRRAPSARCG